MTGHEMTGAQIARPAAPLRTTLAHPFAGAGRRALLLASALSLALPLTALPLPGPGAAAQDAPGSSETQSGESAQVAQAAPAGHTLDAITVSATRNPTSAFTYPGMVTVIDREEIEQRQPGDLADLLRFVPGTDVSGGPRRTGQVPNIRGASGQDVAILLDGTRQNFDSGHDGRLFIDPALLRSVEVLRGPASTLYGSGGLGGVISLETVDAADLLRPGQSIGARSTLGYSSANRERFAAQSVYGNAQGLDLLGTVTYRDSGSIKLGDGTELDRTSDEIVGGLAKASYNFADFHEIEASYQLFRNNAEEPNNGQAADAQDIVDKNVRSHTGRLAWRYNDPGNRWVDLDTLVYYTRNEVSETTLDDLGLNPAGTDLDRIIDTVGFRIDNRSDLGQALGMNHRLTYGVEGYETEQRGRTNGGIRDQVPNGTARFGGIFIQDEITMVEPLGAPGVFTLLPGLRYDYYEASADTTSADVSEDRLSPRIGASYQPVEWGMVFANYAEGFRAPTVNELFTDGEHFRIGPIVNRFQPNPELRPQKSRSVELGFGLQFEDMVRDGDAFQVKASRFFTRARDFIDIEVNQPDIVGGCFAPPPFGINCDGTTDFVNRDRAKLQGTEIEAMYETGPLMLALGYSSISGKDETTGLYLGSLYPERLTLTTAYAVDDATIVGWRGTFADSFTRVNSDSERRSGYATHNLFLSWQPFEGPFAPMRVDLGIDNIFDKAYERAYADSVEPGRNYKVRVSYAW